MPKHLPPFLLVAGFVCIGFSMFEFFMLDMWETPKYGWLAFVGMPLVFIGFVLSGSRIQRFLLHQQRDNLREAMKVMGEGLRDELHVACKNCGTCNYSNEVSANYCSHCGTSLSKTMIEVRY